MGVSDLDGGLKGTVSIREHEINGAAIVLIEDEFRPRISGKGIVWIVDAVSIGVGIGWAGDPTVGTIDGFVSVADPVAIIIIVIIAGPVRVRID